MQISCETYAKMLTLENVQRSSLRQTVYHDKEITLEPWSSGYGSRLTFQRSWVRIPAPDTGWT